MSNTKFTTGTEGDSERDYQPDGTKRRRITVFILILVDNLLLMDKSCRRTTSTIDE